MYPTTKRSYRAKKYFFIFFPCFLLIWAALSDSWADLNLNHIRASASSPWCPTKTLFSKPDVFGVLTVSSHTCHSSCPASEMQSWNKNFVTDPVPQREPRSHADCCSELFMSGMEEVGFRVTVHPSPCPESLRSVPLSCYETEEEFNSDYDTS